ncbi:DUF4123 domain-containing protein [Rahnella sp. CJA17(1/100)]|uniref:DUF4123 domain-containing protein n=1 Tax=Rahnella sp. CJA17(1/100) TaxID=2508951 RepID=UPI001F0DA013|nr:DUF4123 domain-containing protein [Rahnella sp. CJA17(1/100)]
MNTAAYSVVMNQLISHPECGSFALVDGLQYERHFGEEIKTEKGIVAPLFDSGPDSRIQFAGPWLFSLNTTIEYREKLQQLECIYPSVSWFLSCWTLENVVNHFKPFLNLQLPDGRGALFRFYDPRILKDIELLLAEKEYEELIAGIECWFLTLNGETYDIKSKGKYFWD